MNLLNVHARSAVGIESSRERPGEVTTDSGKRQPGSVGSEEKVYSEEK
jgi:hypothetical protein